MNKVIVLLLIVSFTIPAFAESDTEIDILFKNGENAVRDARFHDAISYYDQILEQEPENTAALANKAVMLIQLGKIEKAESILDKVLTLNPNHKITLINKAKVLYKQEKFEEAEIYFDKVLEIFPNNLYTLTTKAAMLIKLDRLDEADELLNKAITLNPNHILALSLKSDILLKKGEKSEASQYLTTIAKVNTSLAGKLGDGDQSHMRWNKAHGLVEIQVNDSNGTLIGYMQAKKIRILDHELTNHVLDQWEYKGETIKDGIKYEVLHSENFSQISEHKVSGRSGFGFTAGSNNLWVIFAIHPQFPLQEDDYLTITYTILRQIP